MVASRLLRMLANRGAVFLRHRGFSIEKLTFLLAAYGCVGAETFVIELAGLGFVAVLI